MKAEGGDTNVRIVLGKKSVHMRYATLAGKALPDVNDLGIELSPDDAKDKMIVMCFFDMQQRPSRNCVMQLARRAEELKEKGVVIVAVQASKVEQNTLDEWVKSRSTAFPVGIIEGDEQEKQFAWGVKSLPWLILTDREHVVIAEGFMISELDEKLE